MTPIRHFRCGLAACVALAAAAGAVAQPRIFVNAAATGSATGVSWVDAYPDLQLALAAAPVGADIWIAQGTYYPGPVGAPLFTTFALPSGVTLLGGFAGTETLASERNPAAHPTILSGDIGRDDPAGVIDNVAHVVTASSLTATTILDGLTITAGRGEPVFSPPPGGGLLVVGSSLDVRNCTFLANTTVMGSGSSGGGAAILDGSVATFTNTRFLNNSTGDGGENSLFTQPGGALYARASTLQFLRCDFLENHAGKGANAWCDHGTVRTSWYGSPGGALAFDSSAVRIEACRFIANAAGAGGNGVVCLGGRAGPGSFGGFGAAIYSSGGSLDIVSCVFAGNLTGAPGVSPYVTDPASYGANTIEVVNGTSRIVACTFVANATPAKHNIDLALISDPTHIVWTPGDLMTPIDPRFVSAAGADNIVGTSDDDYRLMLDSPYIDAGVNDAIPGGFTIDAGGFPRFVDIPSVPDTGQGVAPIVDRGAYEARPVTCAADFDGSGVLTVSDIFAFVNAWFGHAPSADFNHSGILSIQDIFDFLNAWFSGC